MKPRPPAREIGFKTFGDADQRVFAKVSSDYNPIHMDPVATRRLLTGRQVVHGMNLLFSALEYWEHDPTTVLYSIRCTFDNPVSVGERVVFAQQERNAQQTAIDASVDGLRCARIVIETAPRTIEPRDQETAVGEMVHVDTLSAPLELEPEAHTSKSYAIMPKSADFASLFPKTERILGPRVSASLAAVSYFVGMVCPGLHSVLSALNIDIRRTPGAEDSLVFHVADYDPRFRMFHIRLEGVIEG